MIFLVVGLIFLQLLSFYLIVLLFLRNARLQELEKRQERILDEMEDSMGAYLLEMQDENNRLLKRLEGRKPEAADKAGQAEDKKTPAGLSAEGGGSRRTEGAAVLYREGISIEEIARRLGIGKTEVELILKFQSK